MSSRSSAPADRYDAFLLDLDGIVYRGNEPVLGAPQVLEELRRRGRVLFVTNNSARTPQGVAERLRGMGVAAEAHEIVTSADAVVPLLRDRAVGSVFVIGEEGIRVALTEAGVNVADGEPERVDAVVVGWDRSVDYDKLRTASVLVQRGARLVGTNADASYPAPGAEVWPGAGALLAAVETTTGVTAEVAGKPHPPLFRTALERAGTRRALVVGDRIETDIAGARAAGLDSALVLTGASGPADLLTSDALPGLVLGDLRELFEDRPQAPVRRAKGESAAVAARLVKDAGLDAAEGEAITMLLGERATASVQVNGDEAYLHSVAVRKDARGTGLGTLAVAAAASEARSEGARRCFLVTEGEDGFFGRLGFEPVARENLPGWMEPLTAACTGSAVAMQRLIAAPRRGR